LLLGNDEYLYSLYLQATQMGHFFRSLIAVHNYRRSNNLTIYWFCDMKFGHPAAK